MASQPSLPVKNIEMLGCRMQENPLYVPSRKKSTPPAASERRRESMASKSLPILPVFIGMVFFLLFVVVPLHYIWEKDFFLVKLFVQNSMTALAFCFVYLIVIPSFIGDSFFKTRRTKSKIKNGTYLTISLLLLVVFIISLPGPAEKIKQRGTVPLSIKRTFNFGVCNVTKNLMPGKSECIEYPNFGQGVLLKDGAHPMEVQNYKSLMRAMDKMIRVRVPEYLYSMLGGSGAGTALKKCWPVIIKQHCNWMVRNCSTRCKPAVYGTQSIKGELISFEEYVLCQTKRSEEFVESCTKNVRDEIGKQYYVFKSTFESEINRFLDLPAGDLSLAGTKLVEAISDFFAAIHEDFPHYRSRVSCDDILENYANVSFVQDNDDANVAGGPNCSMAEYEAYTQSKKPDYIGSGVGTRATLVAYDAAKILLTLSVCTLFLGTIAANLLNLKRWFRSGRKKNRIVSVGNMERITWYEGAELVFCLLVAAFKVHVIISKMIQMESSNIGPENAKYVYVFVFKSIAMVTVLIDVTYVLYTGKSLFSCAIRIEFRAKRNRNDTKKFCLIRYYRKFKAMVNLRDGNYFYEYWVFHEAKEIILQLFTLNQLAKSNDLQYVKLATCIFAFNLITSPALFGMKHFMKEDVNRQLLYIVDGILDFLYFTINMSVLQPGDLTNVIIIYSTLWPALSIGRRMRTIARAITIKAVQRSSRMKQMYKRKTVMSVVGDAKKTIRELFLSKSNRSLLEASTGERARNGFVALLSLFGLCSLAFFVVQTSWIDHKCGKKLGIKIWEASHPRYVFKDGLLESPKCHFANIRSVVAPSKDIHIVTEYIGDLVNLKVLNLSSNNIKSLPRQILNLRELEKMDLSHNEVAESLDWANQGLNEFPSHILNFLKGSLRSLSLKGNNITRIEGSLAEFDSLEFLDLSANNIQHLSPRIVVLWQNNLKTLDISANPVTIELTWANLEADIHPISFQFLQKYFMNTLRNLNLHHDSRHNGCPYNDITKGCNKNRTHLCDGDLNEIATSLPFLRSLNVTGHCFTKIRTFPENWSNMTVLDISENPIDDFDDNLLHKLNHRTKIYCRQTETRRERRDRTLTYMLGRPASKYYRHTLSERSSSITRVELITPMGRSINLTAEVDLCLLQRVEGLTGKEHLYWSTKLQGALPMCFYTLRNLRWMQIESYRGTEQLGESVKVDMLQLPQLHTLRLMDWDCIYKAPCKPQRRFYFVNPPTDISSSLGHFWATNVCYLTFFHKNVFPFKNLKILSLGKARADNVDPSCNGPFDENIFSLNATEYFSLYGNMLSGPLPDRFLGMRNVLEFDLYNHPHLNGSFPEFENGSFPSVKNFIVRKTNLTSSIPESIGNLFTIEVLDLRDNRLNGPVPQALSKLQKLKILNLGGNKNLEGMLSKQLLDHLEFLDISNTNITLDPAFDPSPQNCRLTMFKGNHHQENNITFKAVFNSICEGSEGEFVLAWKRQSGTASRMYNRHWILYPDGVHPDDTFRKSSICRKPEKSWWYNLNT